MKEKTSQIPDRTILAKALKDLEILNSKITELQNDTSKSKTKYPTWELCRLKELKRESKQAIQKIKRRMRIIRPLTAAEHAQTGQRFDPTQPLYIDDDPTHIGENKVSNPTQTIAKIMKFGETQLIKIAKEIGQDWELMTNQERENLIDNLLAKESTNDQT